MFHFMCPQCSQNSITAVRSQCSHCGFDEAMRTGIGDNFHLIQRQRAAWSLSGNFLVPNDMQKVLSHNIRKRNELRDKMVIENIPVHKKYKQEGISDQNLSPYCKTDSSNPDIIPETSAATFHMPTDNSHKVDIFSEFYSVQDSQSFNRGMQVIDNFEGNKPLTVSQNFGSNISYLQSSQNDYAQSKPGSWNHDSLPETSAATIHMPSDNSHTVDIFSKLCSVQDSQSFNRGMQLTDNFEGNKPLTFSQNFGSNISYLQSSQNDYAQSNIFNSEECIEECAYPTGDILAASYPSSNHRNERELNSLESLSEYSLSSEMPLLLIEKIPFTCRYCDVEIEKHAKGDVEKYSCCVCEYQTNKKANIQMHSHIHCPKKICKVCRREYTEGDSHDSEQTCKVCEKKFQCKTMLDNHSFDHKEYFEIHCWVCSRNMDDHACNHTGKNLYVCCVCGYDTDLKWNLKHHNKTHRPKLFCEICREKYPLKEKRFHASEFTCNRCKKEFQCQTLLEDHCTNHKKYFTTNCRICEKKLDGHKIEHEENTFFKCCQEFCGHEFRKKGDLQKHLYTHSGLRLFRCDVCGKRFAQYSVLFNHSRHCIPLPHKCDTCRARFPSSDALGKHRLEKHKRA